MLGFRFASRSWENVVECSAVCMTLFLTAPLMSQPNEKLREDVVTLLQISPTPGGTSRRTSEPVPTIDPIPAAYRAKPTIIDGFQGRLLYRANKRTNSNQIGTT